MLALKERIQIMYKGTVSIISNDSPDKDGLKALSDQV